MFYRYIAVGSSSTREEYFYEYTKSLENRPPELSEAEKKSIARKEREAAAMKKREGEVARKQVNLTSDPFVKFRLSKSRFFQLLWTYDSLDFHLFSTICNLF